MNTFETEIAKLKNLNKQNLAIWERLSTYGEMSLQGHCVNVDIVATITFNCNTIQLQYQKMRFSIPNFGFLFEPEINVFNDNLPSSTYFDLDHVINKYEMLNPTKSEKIILKWKEALQSALKMLRGTESSILEALEISNKLYQLFPSVTDSISQQSQTFQGRQRQKRQKQQINSQIKRTLFQLQEILPGLRLSCTIQVSDDTFPSIEALYNLIKLHYNIGE